MNRVVTRAATVALLPALSVLVQGQPSSGAEPPPDVTAPTVTDRSPAPLEEGVLPDVSITMSMSEPVDPESVHEGTVFVKYGNRKKPAVLSVEGSQIVLDPDRDFRKGETYAVKVIGGEGGVTDLAGNPLAHNDRWTFHVNAAPKIAIMSPTPDLATRDRTPYIQFIASDREGLLPKSHVTVTINGKPREFEWKRSTGSLAPRLKRREHTIEVTAVDAAGWTKIRSWTFSVI